MPARRPFFNDAKSAYSALYSDVQNVDFLDITRLGLMFLKRGLTLWKSGFHQPNHQISGWCVRQFLDDCSDNRWVSTCLWKCSGTVSGGMGSHLWFTQRGNMISIAVCV